MFEKKMILFNRFSWQMNLLKKNYLSELTAHEVVPIPPHIESLTVRQHIRLFKITKIVYDQNEDISEKLINIFNTVGNLNSSLILILDSKGTDVDLYIGVRSIDPQRSINEAKRRIAKKVLTAISQEQNCVICEIVKLRKL
ncbi:hypothetical protein LR69_04491 [Geobacillus sp. BCO2]|nr:hypothetical protein LR69_04491 [Geobacillus sp. BCO2]